jgi:hypothetical protein
MPRSMRTICRIRRSMTERLNLESADGRCVSFLTVEITIDLFQVVPDAYFLLAETHALESR